jgi:hypothetical protein
MTGKHNIELDENDSDTTRQRLFLTMDTLIGMYNSGKDEFTISYQKKSGEAGTLKVTIEEE